jgi:Flp pilus assembly protein TadD
VALHLARNDPGKALAVVQEEYKRYPNNPQLRNLLLGAAVASGATGAAIEVAQKLALESPNSAELAIQLALLYHRNGDRERAIPEIRRAIQLSPKDPLAYSFLADLLAASGHVQEAIPLYRQSLQLGSQNPAVMNNLAYWLAESGGNLEEASKLALAALQASPESQPIQDTVGWIYLKQKQTDSAIQTFRTLVSRAPSNTTYRMHLGMALREKGDRVGARREFEEALKNNPSPSDRARLENLLQM